MISEAAFTRVIRISLIRCCERAMNQREPVWEPYNTNLTQDVSSADTKPLEPILMAGRRPGTAYG